MGLAREVLSGYEHGVWNGVAALIFFTVFLGIVAWVMRKGAKAEYERIAKLPLE